MPRWLRRRLLPLLGCVALSLAACGAERPADVVVSATPAGHATTEGPTRAEASTSTGGTSTTSESAESESTESQSADSQPAESQSAGSPPPAAPAELIGHHVPVVVAEYPHDDSSWIQGLEWHDGQLLESSGLVGESSLRLVDAETGEPTVLLRAPAELFAEGVTVVDGEAVQITYKDRAVLRTPLPLDPASGDSFERSDNAYDGEGWGLCFNGEHLVMSNGSDELVFRDPDTFRVERSVVVTNGDRSIDNINELECVGDQILANVWLTSSIIAIDAATGVVEGSIDASSLVPTEYRDDTGAVLNGIAYNPETNTYWLTGKLWPVMYEVTFTRA